MAEVTGLPPTLASLTAPLVHDLLAIFGARLRSVVAHGPRVRARVASGTGAPPIATLVIVDKLEYRDLVGAAARTSAWKRAGLAVPLLLGSVSLRAVARHLPRRIRRHHRPPRRAPRDRPLAGLTVQPPDLRRACERWAKSHLIHLREGLPRGRRRRTRRRRDDRGLGVALRRAPGPDCPRGHDDSGPDAIARASPTAWPGCPPASCATSSPSSSAARSTLTRP